jgi:5'(3')-deoxyribonucleotidase
MDEVLNTLLESWVEYLNARFGKNAKAEDINAWDLRCIYPDLTDEEVNSPLYDGVFWEMVRVKPHSVEALKEMVDDGHEVFIVTAQLVYQTIPEKMDWLFEKFPYLLWDNVIITRRKQLVKGDVLIDDAVHNLEGGDYMKILMDCPNNRRYDAEGNGMYRVYDLKEAYRIIKEKKV